MQAASQDQRVRLISQGYNTWRVQVLFSERELSAEEITNRLREVKQQLARQFGVPDAILEYSRLLSKQTTRNGLLVQIQIVKQDLPSAAPVIRTQPMCAPDGSIFSDMRLEADFHPFDEYDHPLTRLSIEGRLKTSGYDTSLVNWDTVTEAICEMEITAKPVYNLEIGRGMLPDPGRSSRLTFGIRPDQEAFLASAWMGVRPVLDGDFLLEVSSPSSGHKWGKNVFGRELEPRQGLQTKLEAGDGTKLRMRGTQLFAASEGMLVFERIGRDKRDCDAFNLVPAKIVGHVRPMSVFRESQVYDLDLTTPAMVTANVLAGSRIVSSAPLLITGDIEENTRIECADSLRVAGTIKSAAVVSGRHCCISGFVMQSDLRAVMSLQIDGGVFNSSLQATDVMAREIRGGAVEALRQTSFDRVDDTGGNATAIRINLNKFLQHQQVAGREAIKELQQSLAMIVDIFGHEITLQVTESTAQRMLLHWLRQRKTAGTGNFTHMEVQDYREILEMVPLIREQLKALGMELRDITAQLVSDPNTSEAEIS
ncbi:DUF342 domain-containing protein [candidate division KSB1 bacterium]|nr:MAG: DUF342 domain-containing protein [candidate division KSB1 bacterium]